MDNAPTSSRRIPGLDDAAVTARLAAIEERLEEIIKRLDEMKNLLTIVDYVQPNRQCP